MLGTYKNIIQAIGHTPLIHINHLNPNKHVNILAKAEGFNPSGSIKDRIALKMIEQAENEGQLTKEKIILEATSGNTGISLAMIAAVKDYQITIVMSEAVSEERRKVIKAFGGKVILTPKEFGTDGAIRKVQAMKAENPNKYFLTDQFTNKYNKLAHYRTTAQEIWEQTGGEIDYFVSSIGTSGTIMGIGKALKENKPDIKIVCAHPEKGHYIQGLKNLEEAIIPAIYDPSLIDIKIDIATEAAFEMSRQIVKQEGIFVGMSSGAAVLAAIKVAESISSGNIVVILPDRGEKYLSTPLFNY